MKRIVKLIGLAVLSACAPAADSDSAAPRSAPEFTHRAAADWINSPPLTLAALRGKVVLIEFWAFECVNCLNSAPWVESVARAKATAGLVVVGVHTPELPDERSPENVRRSVERLRIRYPVMIDGDYSYWEALHNRYWPAFYLIGRDGLLYGSAVGELHSGEDAAQRVEALIERLLEARAP